MTAAPKRQNFAVDSRGTACYNNGRKGWRFGRGFSPLLRVAAYQLALDGGFAICGSNLQYHCGGEALLPRHKSLCAFFDFLFLQNAIGNLAHQRLGKIIAEFNFVRNRIFGGLNFT